MVLTADHCGYSHTVTDAGSGLRGIFSQTNSGSLGQGILRSFACQLDGNISFEPSPGTVPKLVFEP